MAVDPQAVEPGAGPSAAAPAARPCSHEPRPPDRLLEPLRGDRLHQIVGGVDVEGMDGMIFIGGDEDDGRRDPAAIRSTTSKPFRPGMAMSRKTHVGPARCRSARRRGAALVVLADDFDAVDLGQRSASRRTPSGSSSTSSARSFSIAGAATAGRSRRAIAAFRAAARRRACRARRNGHGAARARWRGRARCRRPASRRRRRHPRRSARRPPPSRSAAMRMVVIVLRLRRRRGGSHSRPAAGGSGPAPPTRPAPRDVDLDPQPLAEARLLDRRDRAAAGRSPRFSAIARSGPSASVQRRKVDEVEEHRLGLLVALVHDQAGDRIERVEQEMRIELVAKGRAARLASRLGEQGGAALAPAPPNDR